MQLLSLRAQVADELYYQQIPPQYWAQLYKLASIHRVDTLLAYQLRKRGLIKFVPPLLARRWDKQILDNSVKNLGLYAELDNIIQVLNRHNIIVIALKGLFLADKVYKNIGIRRMSDIDILLPDHRIEEAYHLLIDHLGYTIHGGKSLSLNKGGHIAPLVSPTGIIIELHWTIMLGQNTAEDVVRRAVPVKLLKSNLLTLDAEDNILYLCKHVAHTHRFGYGGLRAICDIAWAIEYYGMDLNWDILVVRGRDWGWERIIYLALAVSERLVGAKVDEKIFAALCDQSSCESMIETAVEQLFATETTGADPVSDNISSFWQEQGFKNKLAKLFWAVFIPREKMIQINQLAPNSWRVYWLYVPRIYNLIKSHTGTLFQLGTGNDQMNAIASRRNALAKWMDGV